MIGPVRSEVRAGDAAAVRRIVESTGFFTPAEVDVAVELVEERLARGIASGYHFLFVDEGERGPIAYACFGPIACTVSSFDVYWIAVEASHQSRGLGRELMSLSEDAIAALGGTRAYVETSGKPQYEPTRRFYLRCGYTIEAELPDFYAPGDAKVILVKALQR